MLEEGLKSHKTRKVYVETWGQAVPNAVYVNITDTINLKIAALKKHVSQVSAWDPEPQMREWSAKTAAGKEMQYAESYRVVTLVNDTDFEKM